MAHENRWSKMQRQSDKVCSMPMVGFIRLYAPGMKQTPKKLKLPPCGIPENYMKAYWPKKAVEAFGKWMWGQTVGVLQCKCGELSSLYWYEDVERFMAGYNAGKKVKDITVWD